ncbi:MAG: tryptophan synthase subunit alpha [Anaerolineae bacterium]|nr:tryptophan synthase subunit alpha [Anaerolineae bacterium]
MSVAHTGLESIAQTFAQARAAGRATFMPFWTIGYPDYATSIAVIEALVASGADALELGVPFSDPLADGPTIQHASQVSLQNGTRLADCIEAVTALRARGVTIPLVLMGYVNPVIAYGVERYAHDAAAAGASGFIMPDLPMEEAGEIAGYCATNGLALIPLLAPTSTPERIRQVVAEARGFVYLVSVTGVTGARDALPIDLTDYVRRVRSLTTLPLAIGFGISQPDQVKTIAALADGVVVASALIRLMESQGIGAVKELAASLRAACG